jgi:hypothetical protein
MSNAQTHQSSSAALCRAHTIIADTKEVTMTAHTIRCHGATFITSDPDDMWDLASELHLHDVRLDTLPDTLWAPLSVHDDVTQADLLHALYSANTGAAHLVALPTDSTWAVDMRHDTTMWNEGFDIAAAPRATVHTNNRNDADQICAAINAGTYNPGSSYPYTATVRSTGGGHSCYTFHQADQLLRVIGPSWNGL